MSIKITDAEVDEVIEEIKSTVYETDSGMQFTKHPLYQSIWGHQELEAPYTPADGFADGFGEGWFNRVIRHKLEVIAQAKAAGDFSKVIWMLERPYRVDMLRSYIMGGQLDSKMHSGLIIALWQDTEFPHQSKEAWQHIFMTTTARVMCLALDDDELIARNLLPDQVTIYRGAGGYDDDVAPGFSWTLNKDKALWFARRFNKEAPRLFTATVNKNALVGPLTARSEDEMLLLNPHEYDIQELEVDDE